MKIICIGRNYAAHAKELSNEVPKNPVFFLKPDSALLQKGKPFYIPDFSDEIHYEVELVIKIKRLGKNIGKKFAHRYYDELGIGIDFTARDIQRECKEKGLPWEIAKAFDHSAVIGDFVSKSKFENLEDIEFSLLKNGKVVQLGNSANMLFKVDEIISYVSKFMTLKIGDMIFTGTPAGVGAVAIGDHLEAFIGEDKMLDCEIK
ncbi:FAA hydrolase family protein [Puteibacter caeruleilacunae]|nr:FAA hydrolase family protein [Puteibacter caeruleilacunae]